MSCCLFFFPPLLPFLSLLRCTPRVAPHSTLCQLHAIWCCARGTHALAIIKYPLWSAGSHTRRRGSRCAIVSSANSAHSRGLRSRYLLDPAPARSRCARPSRLPRASALYLPPRRHGLDRFPFTTMIDEPTSEEKHRIEHPTALTRRKLSKPPPGKTGS